jgi:hypothetical protein
MICYRLKKMSHNHLNVGTDLTCNSDRRTRIAFFSWVLLWYPQINTSHSFLSIERPKRFHTALRNVTSMIHTGANFRTKLEKGLRRASAQ